MITIAELIAGTPSGSDVTPEVNPLTQNDALQEAQLLALRFEAVTGVAALLFELRMALQLHETNTGVLVARGVRQLSWSGPERATSRTAWTIGGSSVLLEGGLVRLELGLWPAPGARLELVSESATFFAGDVPGLSDVPPDYLEDDDATIRSGLPSWDSPFAVASTSHHGG